MENSRFYYMQNYCSFAVARNKFDAEHSYKTDVGFVLPHIGYIAKGSVIFQFEDIQIAAGEGDVVFIPAGVAYCSEWKGDSHIDMYVLECDIDFWSKYEISAQKIKYTELGKAFENLHSETVCGNDFSAMMQFYNIINVITKSLRGCLEKKPKITQRAVAYIEKNLSLDFSVKELSELCGLSESRFFAVFKKENGYSPIDYKNLMRIRRAIAYLKRDSMNSEQICEKLNFSSVAYFRRILKKFTGKTPSRIAKEHEM